MENTLKIYNVNVKETNLKGCFVVEPKVHADSRGYFFETFNLSDFEQLTAMKINFVQDNEALSNRGVVRGLHLQKGKFAQAKLVRVIKGKVLDVVVDLREDSNTFGEYFSIILSEENKKQLFVPRGFAHGYSVLEDYTIFAYKCDNFYYPNKEEGILYNDESLNIDWKLNPSEMIISEKDKKLPKISALKKVLTST